MRTKRAFFSVLLSVTLVSLFIPPPAVLAQHTDSVALSVTPALFSAGQPASTLLCVSSIGATSPTLQPGDKFTFTIAATLGTLTTFVNSPLVSSATLAAHDFAAAFGTSNNQIVVTYSGVARTFAFGDSVSVRINFNASSQIATGTITLNSRFNNQINGSWPYVTASIVNF